MKRILIILLLALTAHTAMAQSQTDVVYCKQRVAEFIDNYRDGEGVTVVEINESMTKVLASKLFEKGDDESAKLLRSIGSITIFVENNTSGNTLKDVMFAVPNGCAELELTSSITNEGKVTKFYFADVDKAQGDCEFLMLVSSAKERIMLYITGDFSIADISALSSLGSGIGK